jgi:hypothetical protein
VTRRAGLLGALATVGVLVAAWLAWPAPGGDSTGRPAPGQLPPGQLAIPTSGRPWAPTPGQPWQWQLTTPVDQTVDVPVYDIDGFENSAEVVRELHQRGRRVICYVVVGSAEEFRPDYGAFPREVIGKPNGWEGERWLDIRRIDVLGPIIAKRFDMCRDKGFDAIEPDLMDNYANDTGFDLSAADQLRYNRFVARLAHDRGLGVGLKNDFDQVPELVGDFEFAVVEECAQFGECRKLAPFLRAGKAVLHVEYKLEKAQFCADPALRGFSSMRKELDLDASRTSC